MDKLLQSLNLIEINFYHRIARKRQTGMDKHRKGQPTNSIILHTIPRVDDEGDLRFFYSLVYSSHEQVVCSNW